MALLEGGCSLNFPPALRGEAADCGSLPLYDEFRGDGPDACWSRGDTTEARGDITIDARGDAIDDGLEISPSSATKAS